MAVHLNFYRNNKDYSNFLNKINSKSYSKYITWIVKLTKNNSYFLDVGCGTGKVFNKLRRKKLKLFGLEVSKSNISLKNNKEFIILYDGKKFPLKNSSFDCVGSFTVLEHIEDPENIISEKIRILKKNGYIIIACPNFLAISNSYHPMTQGILRKIKNFFKIIKKLVKYYILSESYIKFEKMDTIKINNFSQFKPDYDAITLTNPLDIIFFLRKNNIKILYYSSMIYEYKKNILTYIRDLPFIKYFLGAVFIIGKKG